MSRVSSLSVLGGFIFLISAFASSTTSDVKAVTDSSAIPLGALVDKDGVSQFLDGEAIQTLIREDCEKLSHSPAVITDAQMAHYRVSRLIESTLQSELDNQGCVAIGSSLHREEMFLKPPDTFPDPKQGSLQTPLDLAERAPDILVVEIKGTNSGVLDGELGTLVRFEVIEWLKRESRLDPLGEHSYFLSPNLRLEVEDRTYCQHRPESAWPLVGEQYVLFGYRERTITKFFVVGNLFPLDGNILLPQPYFLMNSRLPISLAALKESLE